MKIGDLRDKSIVILGIGQEGLSTFAFLRECFPEKLLGMADQASFERLTPDAREVLRTADPSTVHLGRDYLSCLAEYEVIIKAPGIPLSLRPLQQAIHAGKTVTSHTGIFFANCPGAICGITGTKGKSTTSSLIHAVLSAGGIDSFLVGNIGNPPLSFLSTARPESVFVYELSSHQLDGLTQSPSIAVVLNVVPEHLDYYESFEHYTRAKQNITRFQRGEDYLIYNAAFPIPRRFAAESAARKVPFSTEGRHEPGCFIEDGKIVYCSEKGKRDRVLSIEEVPLLGGFNLQNILASVAVGRLLGVTPEVIARAIGNFRSLPHRLELVGNFSGITFYDDALATIPEATIAALDALGSTVETVLLGGFDRHLDFSELARRLGESEVKNLILFPTTGRRIWEAVTACPKREGDPLQSFFVADMAEAVSLAFRYTRPGKICLHSPASPSFGIFANYKERGNLFQRCVRGGGNAGAEFAGTHLRRTT